MKTFRVSIRDIKDRVGDEKQIRAETGLGKTVFRDSEIDIRKTHISGVARNISKGIEFAANVDLSLTLECSRCLEKFQHPMKIKLKELFYFNDNEADYKVEDDSINIGRIIVESIVLNLEIKTLCKLNCKGVCPNCGINLNKESCNCQKKGIDPRFNKLKELKEKFQKLDKREQRKKEK